MDKEAPTLKIVRYIERSEEAIETCDWPNAMKYDLNAGNIHIEADHHLLLHVYEVNPITCEELIVHTLFPRLWHRDFDFRQVLEPGSEGPRCYRVEQQDWAGNMTPSSLTKCWNPIENHEEIFWGCSETTDTAISLEEEVIISDTSSPEESNNNSTPLKDIATSESSEGCSGFAGLALIPMLLYRHRKKYKAKF